MNEVRAKLAHIERDSDSPVIVVGREYGARRLLLEADPTSTSSWQSRRRLECQPSHANPDWSRQPGYGGNTV